MELRLQRHPSKGEATLGELFIGNDPERECFTLEDVIREIHGKPVAEWKIPGKTAISAGRYRVFITKSQRFHDEPLPILFNVEGFSGIRIHAGNTTKDTEGCLLVGLTRSEDDQAVWNSKLALSHLQPQIQQTIDGGDEVWITIINPAMI